MDIAPVPGTFTELTITLEKYGTLILKDVLTPAIELAENGFPIPPIQIKWLKKFEEFYSKWPDSKGIFMPQGRVIKVGEIFVQHDLAETMKILIAAEQENRWKDLIFKGGFL